MIVAKQGSHHVTAQLNSRYTECELISTTFQALQQPTPGHFCCLAFLFFPVPQSHPLFLMQSHLVRRYEGQPLKVERTVGHLMGTSVRIGLSPEWRPVWLVSLANPPGTVFLHCTHCHSESPVEAHSVPSQSWRRRATIDHRAWYRIPLPHPNTAHSRMATVPRWLSKDQINMKGDGKQDGRGEEGKGRNKEDLVFPVIIWISVFSST